MYEDTHESDSTSALQELYIPYHDSGRGNTPETFTAPMGVSPWITTFDFNFHLTTTHNSLATSQCYEGSHSSPRCLMSRVFSRRMNSPQPLCVAPDVLTLNPYEVASDLPDGLLDMSAGDSPVLTATNAHNVPLPEATEGEYIAHKPTTRPSHDGEENIIDDETLIRRGNATGGPVQISLAPSSPVPSAITSRKVRSRLYRERASRPLLPRLDKTRSSKGSCGQSKTSALTSETFNADQPEPLDHDNSNNVGTYRNTLPETTLSRRSSTAEVDTILVLPRESSPARPLQAPPSLQVAGGDTPGGHLEAVWDQHHSSTPRSSRPSKKRIVDTNIGGAILGAVEVHHATTYLTRSQTRRTPATMQTFSKRRRSDTDLDEDEDVSADNDSDYIPEESDTTLRSRTVKKRTATRQTRRLTAPSSPRSKVRSSRGSEPTYYYRGTKKFAYCHAGDQKRLTISKCHRPVCRIRDSPKRHLLGCESFKTSAYYQNHLKKGMNHKEIAHYAARVDRKFAAALPCVRSTAYKELLRKNGHTHEEVLQELQPYAKIYQDGDCDCCPFDSISTYRKERQAQESSIVIGVASSK
ncbi:hypothetical protein ONZ51_g813 [Trametes cubensis]|uniref:Uncharacterized protein n=1 Tax=Trametes cubensis TaxID=1111947 RepID=A0AAD7U3E7_9APHY|nr:hypothetical protein ONZ51_g813 [Trametes cubensis]